MKVNISRKPANIFREIVLLLIFLTYYFCILTPVSLAHANIVKTHIYYLTTCYLSDSFIQSNPQYSNYRESPPGAILGWALPSRTQWLEDAWIIRNNLIL